MPYVKKCCRAQKPRGFVSMARTRALYVLALAGVYVFYCNYYGFFAVLVLRCALAAPVVSLVLGALAALCTRVCIEAPAECRIGQVSEVHVRCTGHFLPVRFGGRLEACVLLTGEVKRTRFSTRAEWVCPADTEHCGCVRYTLARVWAADPLGLFCLPLRRPQAAAVTVWPVPEAPYPMPPMPDALAAESLAAKPGGGYSEEHDLRPYRPGDAVNTIHWKLSAKADGLIVREPLCPRGLRAALFLDARGTAAERDRAFARLLWMTKTLLAAGVSHLVLTFADGNVYAVSLQVEDDLMALFRRLLAQPVPQGAPMHALPPQLRAQWQYTVHGKEVPHA